MSARAAAATLLRLVASAHPAIWTVTELMAAVATQIVLTPVLLHRLGAQQFSVWVLAQSVIMAAATLSFGAGTALLPALSGAWARCDAAGAQLAIRLFAKRTASTSLVLLCALAAAIQLHWLDGLARESGQHDLPLLALVTLVWLVMTEFDAGASSALKALGRFNTVAQFEIAIRAAQLALTIGLVATGSRALVPIGVAAAVTAGKAVCKFVALRKRWPSQDGAQGIAGLGNVPRELNAAGAWAWLGVATGLAFHVFDRWFVGGWLGSAALAAYAVCSQLAQLPHAVVSAAGQTLVPWAAERRHRLSNPAVRREVRRLMAAATLAAALPSLLLLLLLEPILSLWISTAFASQQLWLARGMTVAFLLLSLNVPSYFLQFGFGRARVPMLIGVFAGAVFVLGCLLLPASLAAFVAMKGLFGVLSLSLVVHFLRSSGAPN